MTARLAFGAIILVLGSMAGAAGAQTPRPGPQELFRDDVHAKVGLTLRKLSHRGQRPMDGPTAKVAKLSPAEIRQWITSPAEMTAKLDHKPVNAMKKTELSETEVSALVAYMLHLRTLK